MYRLREFYRGIIKDANNKERNLIQIILLDKNSKETIIKKVKRLTNKNNKIFRETTTRASSHDNLVLFKETAAMSVFNAQDVDVVCYRVNQCIE